MGKSISLSARVEVTGRYAHAYVKASKKVKGQILDQVVEVTGWSRDNARRRLVAASREARTPSGRPSARPAVKQRKPRTAKYSYDTLQVLQRVWAATGGQCGKYLAASMALQLDLLEAHGELAGQERYGQQVRDQLLSMSPATIDRYLAPVKAKALRGKAATKPSPLLRSSIAVRRAGDEVEAEPGFFEGDTVAHCGPTLRGEFARTLNLVDVHTGWVFTRSIRNNARTHVLTALKAAVETIPFEVAGLDFDNGSEFINHDLVAWAGSRGIYFTRSRPYKKNDQAKIESKNNHLVRKYAFYWRYDTAEERAMLNRLWKLVCDRMNYLTPTTRPVGWGTDSVGRRKRLYDAPQIPLDRLIAAGVLSPTQQAELLAYRATLNPAEIGRRISEIQLRLTAIAKAKTEQMVLTAFPPALPDIVRGIHIAPKPLGPTDRPDLRAVS